MATRLFRQAEFRIRAERSRNGRGRSLLFHRALGRRRRHGQVGRLGRAGLPGQLGATSAYCGGGRQALFAGEPPGRGARRRIDTRAPDLGPERTKNEAAVGLQRNIALPATSADSGSGGCALGSSGRSLSRSNSASSGSASSATSILCASTIGCLGISRECASCSSRTCGKTGLCFRKPAPQVSSGRRSHPATIDVRPRATG